MTYSYDHFVARLRCPSCGTFSPQDDSIELFTYLSDSPSGAWLAVGDTLRIDRQQLALGLVDGYFAVSTPVGEAPVVLLNSWRCRQCGAFNWARITVADDTIESIEPVVLTREALSGAHLLAREAEYLAMDFCGVGSDVLSDSEVLDALCKHLPAEAAT